MYRSQAAELANEIENEDESEWDLFQIEVIDGDIVWACNLCDQGVDSSLVMKEHMQSEHDRVVNIDTLNNDASSNECNIEDEGNEKGNTEKTNETEVKEDNKIFTCQLVKLFKLDGKCACKEHYIKGDINHTKLGNNCEYCFCMDIEQGRCSQFCNYYQNMLD